MRNGAQTLGENNMAICWRNYIHAEAIFTYAHHEQQMGHQDFKLDITESEDKVIFGLIKSMFNTEDEYEREMMSDIVKVSFCLSNTELPTKMKKKEEEQVWNLPFMKAFLARNGKYYFDEEQRDEVESSIKELIDCCEEEA
jgi:hypothetical protein|tara:strand:+ start:179 stop:601 length:423 start_codon:yes stop_codon:yes gene_type:complete